MGDWTRRWPRLGNSLVVAVDSGYKQLLLLLLSLPLQQDRVWVLLPGVVHSVLDGHCCCCRCSFFNVKCLHTFSVFLFSFFYSFIEFPTNVKVVVLVVVVVVGRPALLVRRWEKVFHGDTFSSLFLYWNVCTKLINLHRVDEVINGDNIEELLGVDSSDGIVA